MPLSRRQFAQLIGLGAFSAAAAQAPSSLAQSNGVVHIGLQYSDSQTLDPHYAAGTQDRILVDMIFNGLVRFVPGTSDQFEADLAEEIPEGVLNEDGTQTWTFKLKSGVMTHGSDAAEATELSVDDLLFSFNKAASLDSSAYAGDYEGWTFDIGADEREFNVTVPGSLSPTLFLPKVANYSGGYVIPRKAYEAIGSDNFITNPVGTGPFQFVEHLPQLSVELAAYPDFFRGSPLLEGVEVIWQPNVTSRENGLMAGDFDVIQGLTEATWAMRVGETEGFSVDIFGPGEPVWLNLNVEHEILSDIRVREAIVLAINRDSHVALFGEPVGVKLESVIHGQQSGSLTQEQAEEAGVNYQQDIERAKQLLAEAGYPDGFELDLVTSESISYRQSYEVLQEELRQIGIDVTLEVVQHATMHGLIREDRNAITIYIAYRPSADTTLTQFFTTDGGATNFSKFTVDEIRDEARAATDDETQAELWRKANIEILRNFAGFGLLYTNLVWVRRDDLDWGHEPISIPQGYPGLNESSSMEVAN